MPRQAIPQFGQNHSRYDYGITSCNEEIDFTPTHHRIGSAGRNVAAYYSRKVIWMDKQRSAVAGKSTQFLRLERAIVKTKKALLGRKFV